MFQLARKSCAILINYYHAVEILNQQPPAEIKTVNDLFTQESGKYQNKQDMNRVKTNFRNLKKDLGAKGKNKVLTTSDLIVDF